MISQPSDVVRVVADLAVSAASGLLIFSGGAKMASPQELANALEELGTRRLVGSGAVRLLAACEVLLGFLLVTPSPARVAGAGTLILGGGLALVGVAGLVRGAEKPCGCFGKTVSKPIGWATILAGTFFVICGAAVLVGYGVGTWALSATLAAPLASLVALLLTFGTHRELIKSHFTLARWRSAEVSNR